MPKIIIQSNQAPVTGFTTGKPSPLAQAIRAGDFIYVSGQGPLDPVTRQVVSDDVRVQAKAVLENIRTVLEAGGATIAHIVNVRVSLRDTADFAAFNEVFTEWVDGEKVTRTCVGALPHRSGVKVEVDCVAYLG
jgi:2-iminobutanoate/2-iminopropanoate deaminase